MPDGVWAEVGRVVPGDKYRDHAGHRYRAECFAFDLATGRTVVVCERLDGPGAGVRYVTSLGDFVTRFRPEAATEAAARPAPLPERLAGHREQGSGA